MKNEYCVHCGRQLSASIRFGDTFLCNDCVPRCQDCGVSFRHTNRRGEVCEFCWENYSKRRDVCASCGTQFKTSNDYYNRYGNYCIHCNTTFEQLSKKKPKVPIEELIKEALQSLF